MGKLQINDSIPKEDNIIQLLKEPGICKEICDISYEHLENTSKKEELLKNVNKYYDDTHCDESDKIQSGRVWCLIKKQEDCFEVLQVAQALDTNKGKGFFGEIFSHIDEILNKKASLYGSFAEELKKNEHLLFYEIDIEKYLERYAPSDYKDFIYKMGREYFVEASIAHFTQAREWKFYNPGMDKRAYYYLLEHIKSENLDNQIK